LSKSKRKRDPDTEDPLVKKEQMLLQAQEESVEADSASGSQSRCVIC